MLRNAPVLALLCLFLGPLSAAAAEPSAANAIPKGPTAVDLYLAKTDKKFDKGALNFVAGWTEIVNRPLLRLRSQEKKNSVLKFTEGLGQGVWLAVADTVGGFVNAASAPFPQFEIPLPQGGLQVKDVTGGELLA